MVDPFRATAQDLQLNAIGTTWVRCSFFSESSGKFRSSKGAGSPSA
jgi:hypothetical protein